MVTVEEIVDEEEDVKIIDQATTKQSFVKNVECNHPASWEEEIVPPRKFKEDINHPASVKIITRNAKLASDFKQKGNELFAKKQYLAAVDCYTDAIDYASLESEFYYARAVFYANRAACKVEMNDYEGAIEDLTSALELDKTYLKAYIRRSKCYENQDKLEEALADLASALTIDPSVLSVRKDHDRLEKLVKEKQEKLKDEMMGKLKDLGNTILGKFGMSLDNFKMEQDPKTGGYSINFKQ